MGRQNNPFLHAQLASKVADEQLVCKVKLSDI
jgi:hypothetical protein